MQTKTKMTKTTMMSYKDLPGRCIVLPDFDHVKKLLRPDDSYVSAELIDSSSMAMARHM